MDKSAVIYFSASGITKRIANSLAKNVGADIFEIEAKTAYTDDDLNWRDMGCRANREQQDPSARPEIQKEIDLSNYDTIYLGYPIWWDTLPKVINTFVETGALNGKKVFAFCTSGSSSIDTSVSALKKYNLDVVASKRFAASAADSEIKF